MAKVKLKQLESDLEALMSYSNPKVKLEQYPTPPRFAAEVLHNIELTDGIAGKTVLDLGCGCGILGFGCARLAATKVIGVDIDDVAVAIATENRSSVGLSSETISFVHKDVLDLSRDDFPDDCSFDMVIMNPPFGTKEHVNVDTKFVEKGLEFARVVYSIHKSSTRSHWASVVKVWKEKWRRDIRVQVCMADQAFKIPHMYRFHKKQEQEIIVDLVRFSHQ